MSNLLSSNMMIFFGFIIFFIFALYVLSIVWVAKDSSNRGAKTLIWTIIAIIPFVGPLAYICFRPDLNMKDHEEQNLAIVLKRRQLSKYGKCSRCGYQILNDYLFCPNCKQKLKKTCSKCGKPLEFKWVMCPYCGDEINNKEEPIKTLAEEKTYHNHRDKFSE